MNGAELLNREALRDRTVVRGQLFDVLMEFGRAACTRSEAYHSSNVESSALRESMLDFALGYRVAVAESQAWGDAAVGVGFDQGWVECERAADDAWDIGCR